MASRPLADIVADLRNASVSGELTDAQRLELFEPLLSIAATLSKLSAKAKAAPRRRSSAAVASSSEATAQAAAGAQGTADAAVAPLSTRRRRGPEVASEAPEATAAELPAPKRRRQAAGSAVHQSAAEVAGIEAVALAAPAEPEAKQKLAAFFAADPMEALVASADSQRLQDLKRKLLKQKGSMDEGAAQRLTSHLDNIAALFQALRASSPDELHAIMETVASSVLDRWPLGATEQDTALLQSLASFSQELMDELTRRDIRYVRVLSVSSKAGGSSASSHEAAP